MMIYVTEIWWFRVILTGNFHFENHFFNELFTRAQIRVAAVKSCLTLQPRLRKLQSEAASH
jgi:hypothetical protein